MDTESANQSATGNLPDGGIHRRPRGRPRKIIGIAASSSSDAVDADNGGRNTDAQTTTGAAVNETPATEPLETPAQPGVKAKPLDVPAKPTLPASPKELVLKQIRDELDKAKKSEARLLAILGEWKFTDNPAQGLDDIEFSTLDMISKCWARVLPNL